MKPRRAPRAVLLILAGIALSPGAAAAEDRLPVAPGRVELRETPQTITLANCEMALTFERARGRLVSLLYRGRELLRGGQGYVQIALSASKKRSGRWQYRLCRHEPGLVEIAFDDREPQNPFDMAAHYILRADEPGFHNYLVLGHDAIRSPGVHELAQYDFCLRVDPQIFTTAAVDRRRIRPFPTPAAMRSGLPLLDATFRLPDGTIYSKYFFAATMDETHRAHGVLGDDLGLWILMPSHEHLNGGPEHQELTVHQTDTTPVVLRHFTAAHYGAGIVRSDSRAGSWSKASATWMVYVNSGRDPSALWDDAQARAAREHNQWPYAWLDEAQFQLRRGSVTGLVQHDNGAAVGGARIILADHEDRPGPLFWQQQWRGYRFSAWTDATGRFRLDKVRPGLYDLYAWKNGLFGQFVKQHVRVAADAATELGTQVWSLPAGRTRMWQIGVPDRSAAEFGFAADFRQWGLWDKIAAAAPQGIEFVVGKNTDRDWPFQLAVTQNVDFSWRVPVWRIRFENSAPQSGRCLLTLGVAAYEQFQKRSGPQLTLLLNGAPLGTVEDLAESGAAHRSSVHGSYQERQLAFDAARLKVGSNELSLELPTPRRRVEESLGCPAAALMFDALRLEIEPR